MREFGKPGHHRWRNVRANIGRDDVLSLTIELAQTISLLIAIPHSFLANIWLLPSIAPFVPLALAVVRLVARARRQPPSSPPPDNSH